MDRQAECWSPSQHFLPHLFVPGATTELNPLSTISTHPLFVLGATTEPKGLYPQSDVSLAIVDIDAS